MGYYSTTIFVVTATVVKLTLAFPKLTLLKTYVDLNFYFPEKKKEGSKFKLRLYLGRNNFKSVLFIQWDLYYL